MNLLREFRKQAHLSQTRLAHLAKVTPMTISRLEAGGSWPYLETQKRIAAVFRVKADAIFGNEPPPISDRERRINCCWCGGQIAGLTFDPLNCALIVRKMSRAVKVHKNGRFYHEDCLRAKLEYEGKISNKISDR